MTGRGAIVTRRWAAMAAGAALCGWLSTLAPPPGAPPDRTVAAGGAAGQVRQEPRPAATPTPAATPSPRPPVDCRKAKCVALTFDDGPVPGTARLLDMLAAHRVKATFFLVGQNVVEYPHLVRREAAEGHELANHSWSHIDLGRSSRSAVTSQLERTQRAIQRTAGVRPVLMRPPFGSTDGQVASVTRELGLAQVLWAVDPLDWRVRDSDRVERKVVARAGGGDIVLLHDIHATTVDAVPQIIKRLSAKGYVFVTVSELFGERLTPGRKYIELEPEPEPGPGGELENADEAEPGPPREEARTGRVEVGPARP